MAAKKRYRRLAVLASGGVDSACLLEWAANQAKSKVFPVYVSFGLRWEAGEMRALRNFIRALGNKQIAAPTVLQLPATDLYNGHFSITGNRVPGGRSRDAAVYLPGRNLLLLSKAAVFAALKDMDGICIGTLSANPFSDASTQFFGSFEKLASIALGRKLKILAPFRRMTKERLIRRYRHLPLNLCFSCLNPQSTGEACKKCNKCVEWKKAERRARSSPLISSAVKR